VGDKHAQRGVPSLVWREGQERRLAMICAAADGRLNGGRALDVGCGIGVYMHAFRQFTPHVFGIEIEGERARQATACGAVVQSPGEALPFADGTFDLVLSHEVIEHVADDQASVAEMVRVLRSPAPSSGQVGGRLVLFCPNRLYPFETHGHYWRGQYHFGNTPLINYLPNPLRNKLAPHVRAYTRGGLRRLFRDLPAHVITHTQIYPGYDNVVARRPTLGKILRSITYTFEHTPLKIFGLSHFLVIERI
jgi:SAM-dependent methyltransferase